VHTKSRPLLPSKLRKLLLAGFFASGLTGPPWSSCASLTAKFSRSVDPEAIKNPQVASRAWRGALYLGLLRETQLLHVALVIPEQVFLVHEAIRTPMTDRGHADSERLAGRCDFLAVCQFYGLRESFFHVADDARPFASMELDRVLLNARVGCESEHIFQIFDVRLDAFGHAAIGPVHLDVGTMTFFQPFPCLVGEHVKIQRVESCKVLLGQLFSFAIALLSGGVIGVSQSHKTPHYSCGQSQFLQYVEHHDRLVGNGTTAASIYDR
jgi:hypothetical protein